MKNTNKVLIQHLRAKNSTNGNPQRAYLVINPETGNVIEAIDEGYKGTGALKDYPVRRDLPTIEVSVSEYKSFLKEFPALD